jgi:multidrug efflux pump subunit AcrA (membrane-fusion protein)
VVYASSEDRGNYRGDDSPIQAGKRVNQRQEIIRIPDPKGMGVQVKVHESALDRVRVGQTAKVTIDAYPDKPLMGKVLRMSTLPDGNNRWQNPDLKVYPTDIGLEDAPPALRPGMSARVEIIVDDIESALAVPVQAVTTAGGKPAVYLKTASGSAARPVTLGRSSDRFVEVLDGLAEGDVVLLAPPKEAGGPGGEGGAGKGGGRGPGGRGPGGGAPGGGRSPGHREGAVRPRPPQG